MKRPLCIIFFILISAGVASAEFDIVRPNAEYHECVDMAVLAIRENPDLIACSISRFPNFKFSHMVAVKVIDHNTLYIVDGNNSYFYYGWRYDFDYYHFWVDREPLRSWGIGLVKDNRWLV